MMAWRPRHWCFSSRRKPRCERRRKAGVPAGLRPGRLGPPRLALPVPAPPRCEADERVWNLERLRRRDGRRRVRRDDGQIDARIDTRAVNERHALSGRPARRGTLPPGCLGPSNMRRVITNPAGSIANVSSRADTARARTRLRDRASVDGCSRAAHRHLARTCPFCRAHDTPDQCHANISQTDAYLSAKIAGLRDR